MNDKNVHLGFLLYKGDLLWEWMHLQELAGSKELKYMENAQRSSLVMWGEISILGEE